MNNNSERQNIGWGILLICFGISTMIQLYTGYPDWIRISVFFLGGIVGLAFFLADKSDWKLLIPIYIMLSVAAISWLAIFELINEDIIGSVVLTIVAAPFVYVYFQNKNNWWALIPAYSLLSIALIIMLTNINIIGEAFVAPLILFSIAIPFLYVYFKNKENWWALIPAYTMFVIGAMVGLIELNILEDLIVPAYILSAISLPFFVVYFRNNENWWALIPGGVLGFLALGFMLSAPIGNIIIPLVLIVAGVYFLLKKKD